MQSESESERKPEVPASPRDEALFQCAEPSRVPRGPDNYIAVISIFVVLLLEFLNNKIVTPKDVEEHWDIPLLGVIPYEKSQNLKPTKLS